MMCAVLGARNRGRAHAVDLGIGMQLTNIVRDVVEDAERGRVYLPATHLRAEGVDPEDFLAGRYDPAAVTRVLHGLLDLADRYYRSADDGVRDIPPAHRPAVLVAGRVYAAIGRRARRAGSSPLRGRVIVSGPEKLWRVLGALGLALKPRMSGLRAPPAHDETLHRAFAGWPGTRS